MNKADWCKTIAAALAILGCIFSGWFFLDGHFAKASDVQLVELRLDYKIEGDVLNSAQQRLFQLENQYGIDPDKVANPEARHQMKELKAKVDQQNQRILMMEKKIKRIE